MEHLCYLCLMFVMLSGLFIAALWSPVGLFFVMFIVILLLQNVLANLFIVGNYFNCAEKL